jgi:hypothetical protein
MRFLIFAFLIFFLIYNLLSQSENPNYAKKQYENGHEKVKTFWEKYELWKYKK